jgi:hypothetical protein
MTPSHPVSHLNVSDAAGNIGLDIPEIRLGLHAQPDAVLASDVKCLSQSPCKDVAHWCRGETP